MKHYTSIEDIPVYNWFKCIDGNYEYVLLKPVISEDKTEVYKEYFSILYAQFIDKYGVNENIQEIISLQNSILIDKIDLAFTKDKSFETHIEIKEDQLKELLNVVPTKTNSVKIAIEKNLGFPLNMKVVTVVEYYDYIEDLKTEPKK